MFNADNSEILCIFAKHFLSEKDHEQDHYSRTMQRGKPSPVARSDACAEIHTRGDHDSRRCVETTHKTRSLRRTWRACLRMDARPDRRAGRALLLRSGASGACGTLSAIRHRHTLARCPNHHQSLHGRRALPILAWHRRSPTGKEPCMPRCTTMDRCIGAIAQGRNRTAYRHTPGLQHVQQSRIPQRTAMGGCHGAASGAPRTAHPLRP